MADTPIVGGSAAGVFTVQFVSRKVGIAVGGDYLNPTGATGNAAYSRDGGKTWQSPSSFPGGHRSGSSWVPHLSAVAVAAGGDIIGPDDQARPVARGLPSTRRSCRMHAGPHLLGVRDRRSGRGARPDVVTGERMEAVDLVHLRRCVELAAEALEAGDEPFGSVLVDGRGDVRREDRNRVAGGDQTRHPELELARWAATNLTPAERASATVYTSGEHCPMCAAAHAWVGLGRIVYAVSSSQLTTWRTDWGAPDPPVRSLPVGDVAPRVVVEGPARELESDMRDLHHRHLHQRHPDQRHPGLEGHKGQEGQEGHGSVG